MMRRNAARTEEGPSTLGAGGDQPPPARADPISAVAPEQGATSEDFFRAIVEHIPDPVYVREAGTLRFIQVNAAAEALLGIDRKALLGQSVYPASCALQSSDLDRIDRALLAHPTTRRQITEETVATLNGDRTVHTKRIVICNKHGAPEYLLCVAEDITERKAAEREHALLEEQLRHSQRMEAIGTLAGGVAHDINNVLGAITGIVSTLRSEVTEQTAIAQDLDNVLQACKQGRDLTLDLLGFARKGKLRKERVLVNDVVRELLGLLERTISKKISISTDLQVTPPAVEGDPTQLHHALMNICLNAVDAMNHTGQLELRTWTGEDPGIGETVFISVRDTGSGMDEETLAHAFEPFFTTKPDGRGTGLGLSMVYGTVTHHGGRVELHSQPGRGTTVTVLLPLVAAPTRIIPVRSLPPPKAASKCSGTILVVDDEPLIRTSSRRMLKKLGFEVICVENGEKAIEVFEARHRDISLVLLDIMMPVMDGGETLWHLLEIDADVRVILASGYTKDEKARDLLELGARGFVQKPFVLQTLANLIKRTLEQ